MKFFKNLIDKGKDVDIDKAIEIFDSGKKKKNDKQKRKKRCKGYRR